MDGYIRVRVLLTAPPVASHRGPATTEKQPKDNPKPTQKQAVYIARYRRLDAYQDRL